MQNKKSVETRLYECLGAIVSSRRKRLGLSQEELASKSNVDRAFISDIERAKRTPSFGIVARIARGLRMKFARLVHHCERCVESEECARTAEEPSGD